MIEVNLFDVQLAKESAHNGLLDSLKKMRSSDSITECKIYAEDALIYLSRYLAFNQNDQDMELK